MSYGRFLKDVAYLTLLLIGCFSVAKCCSRPDLPDHGYLYNDRDTYNVSDQVTLLCREGYAPKGKNHAICQPNGLWDQKLPSCEKDLAYSKMTKIMAWNEAKEAYLEADSTERLTDGNINTCLRFPLQNDNFHLKIDLGKVYHIGNVVIGLGEEGVHITMKVGVTDTTNERQEGENMCGHFDGILPARGLNLECNKRGNIVSIQLPQSKNPISICKIHILEACPRPELPKNSYLKDDQKVYDVGSSVTILCKEGYAPMGQNFANCLADGSWDSPLPSCEEDVVFNKPTKFQVWDDSIKDFTNANSRTLTDGQLDSCLQLLSGQEYYLEIDLKDTFYISQILMAFGKQEIQVDLEIRIVDTNDYSEGRVKQCGKISEKLEHRGIIVPCRMDESKDSVGLKGNRLLVYLPVASEPVSICKLQAFSTRQLEITINDPDQSDKAVSVSSQKSDSEHDHRQIVESGSTNIIFVSTISTIILSIIIIICILTIFIYSWRKRQACSGYQPC